MDLLVQTKNGVQLVNAYKLTNGMAAHKSLIPFDKSWVVVDIESGLVLQYNVKSLRLCMQYAINNPDKEKIAQLKKGERYSWYMKRLEEEKKKYIV